MRKIVSSLLLTILCGVSYAQDYVTVYQGANKQQFLLSDIDSITHSNNNTVNIHHNGQKHGRSIVKIDSISFVSQISSVIENNPITIIANMDDPELFMFQADENNLVHYYGEKNDEGLPLSINMIVVENENEGNSKIVLDHKMKPLQVHTPVGVIYDFLWNDDYSGVLTAFDISTGTTVKVSFNRNLEDGVTSTIPQSCIKSQHQRGYRVGELKIETAPLINPTGSRKSPIFKSAEDGHQECLVTYKKCDDYFDPNDIYLTIFNKDGWVGDLHDYNKIGTGKYLFIIPSDSYPSIDTAKWAEWINNILGTIGNISLFLTASGGDYYVCGAIATGLTLLSEGAFAACAAQFTTGCVAFNRAITAATLINTGGTDSGASITGNLIEYLKNANILRRVYTGNIWISPIINYCAGVSNVMMTPEDNNVTIPVETEGYPSVHRFYCEPKEPAEGQAYDATIILQCMSPGTTVTMSVVGTDNYKDSKKTTLTSTNATVTLHVPGADKGVCDYIEVQIYDADGELIGIEHASLYFH